MSYDEPDRRHTRLCCGTRVHDDHDEACTLRPLTSPADVQQRLDALAGGQPIYRGERHAFAYTDGEDTIVLEVPWPRHTGNIPPPSIAFADGGSGRGVRTFTYNGEAQ